MAQKTSFLLTEGDPQNTSEFTHQGHALYVAATSAGTTTTRFRIHAIPNVDLYDAQGNSAGSSLAFGRFVQRLTGAYITPATTLAAAATLDLGISVMRSFGTLGVQITNAGGAITSLTVGGNGVNTPMPSGQTFVLTNAAGTAQTWTTSAAVGLGAPAIPVNSQTPTGTNAIGDAFVGQVGNATAFGWLTSGTGVPTLVKDLSLLMPSIPANPAITPFGWLGLYPGDAICLDEQTSTSTVSVPLLTVTTLVL